MKYILLIIPLLLMSMVQAVHAQDPFDIINESVGDTISDTMKSINENMASNNTENQGGNNDTTTTSTTTTTTSNSIPSNSTLITNTSSN